MNVNEFAWFLSYVLEVLVLLSSVHCADKSGIKANSILILGSLGNWASLDSIFAEFHLLSYWIAEAATEDFLQKAI